MRITKQFLIILFSSLFAVAAISQSKQEQKRIAGQVEDFEVFKTSLYELEAEMYRYVSEDSLKQILDELQNSVSSKPYSDFDLYKMYAAVMVKFQSGHTGIQPTKYVIRQWMAKKSALPIDIVVSAGKLYAYKTYMNVSEEAFNKLPKKEQRKHVIEEYAEVVRIDGLDIKEWMIRIADYVGSDENQLEFRYELVKDVFEFFRGLTLDSIPEASSVEYISGKDTLEMFVSLGYPPAKDIAERLSFSQKQYKEVNKNHGSFKVLNGKYGYIQFPSFMNAYGPRYDGFLQETFTKIQKKGIDQLVIDLRGNTGGVIQNELMKYFVVQQKSIGEYHIKKPGKPTYKKYLKKNEQYKLNRKNLKLLQKWEKINGEPYNGVMHANKLNEDQEYFMGKIVVLTDRSTFSAASVLAAQLKKLKGAKIVGVPAGGSYYEGVAGTHQIVLPNSKFAVLLNPNYYKSPYEANRPFDQSIKEPDVYFQAIYGDPKKVDKKNEQNLLKAIKKAFAL